MAAIVVVADNIPTILACPCVLHKRRKLGQTAHIKETLRGAPYIQGDRKTNTFGQHIAAENMAADAKAGWCFGKESVEAAIAAVGRGELVSDTRMHAYMYTHAGIHTRTHKSTHEFT